MPAGDCGVTRATSGGFVKCSKEVSPFVGYEAGPPAARDLVGGEPPRVAMYEDPNWSE